MSSYPKITSASELVQAYKKLGSLKEVSRRHKTAWKMVHQHYQHALAEGLMDKLPRGHKTDAHMADVILGKVVVKKPKIGGRRRALKAKPLEIAPEGVTRFLFTCAQNNTKLHEGFFANLLALKAHYDAELHISRFSYIKHGLGALGDKKTWFDAQLGHSQNSPNPEKDDFWFDPKITPYVSDEQRAVAPGLVWRGDGNISPTAVNPLSGKAGMTGRKSGIFPHVTIALESVPSMEHSAVKFLYTTGTITMRNYIQKDAGFKADFHHTYGALLVEVWEGSWWCRQINADSEGNFQDLDLMVKDGKVEKLSHREHIIDTFISGDAHDANIDPVVKEAIWAKGGILDFLRPKRQVAHDIHDMYARNHHDIKDPHQLHLRYAQGKDNVKKETKGVVSLLSYMEREWCETIVANSNHDRALLTWLKNKNAMFDPVNFEFWNEMNARVSRYTAEHKDFPIILEEAYLAVTGMKKPPKNLRFLAQDESYIVCPDKGGGIEVGAHGDDGPNGSRGTTASFTKIGRRITKGHDHTAAIKQNVHSVGTCRKLRAGRADYAHGPSSWSHTQGIIYASSKRALLTIWKGRAWAPR